MPPYTSIWNSGRTGAGAVQAAIAAALLVLLPQPVTAEPPVLDEIVVSASRTPLPAEEVGSSFTVISAEDLQKRGDIRTAEILRRVPGLSISTAGGFGQQTQLRIRGADANHTLVIIDGIEVSDPSAGAEFFFDNLTSDGIERIEILRGPQSALYGSDSIGGVVQIQTLSPGGLPRFITSLETGSLGTHRASVSGTISEGRLSLAGGIGGFWTDGISAADERLGNPETDGHKSHNLRARAEIALTEQITFDAAGFVLGGDVETDSPPHDNANRSERIERHFRTGVRWQSKDGSAHARADIALSARESDNFGNFLSRTEGRRKKTSIKAGFSLPAPADKSILQSIDFTFEDEREEQIATFGNSGSTKTRGYAAEYRIGLAKQFFVSAGVRHDQNQNFKDTTTGRLSASWRIPASRTRLHASVGTGIKNPTLVEIHGFGASFVGNPNLEPEKAIGWDIGIGQEFLEGRLAFDITGFKNRIRNAINGFAACNPPPENCRTALNFPGTTKSEGIEFVARAELLPELSLRGNWTTIRTHGPDGRERVRHPRHTWTVGLDGNWSLAGFPVMGALELHRTGRQRDDDFSSFPAVRETLRGFSLLSASFSLAVSDRVSLFVRGENLLDQNYQEVINYGALGLTAFIGIRITSGGMLNTP